MLSYNKAKPRGRFLVSSILSVLAGFLVIVILSIVTDAALEQVGVLPPPDKGLFDTGLLLVALIYRCIYSVIGCYFTAILAPDRPVAHALALGLLGVVVSAAGTMAGQSLGPAWYGIALAVLALPLAWLGGKLFELRSSLAS
jgi:hypothetical protein